MNDTTATAGTKDCTVCDLCEERGNFDECREKAVIACHVAAFRADCFTVWRCPSCGSLHSKEAVDLTRYYEAYPLTQHRLDFFARLAYRNRRARLLRAGMQQTARVLDYGCGQGLFIEYMKQHGYANISGYDPHVARFSAPLPRGARWNVICAQDVIEHVPSPRELMMELSGFLEPGGILDIGCPNAAAIGAIDGRRYGFELSQPYHRHIPTRNVLEQLGREAGLTLLAEHNRFYYDTRVPLVNSRFIWSYVEANQGLIDVLFEPIKYCQLLSSPKLLLHALFGFYLPPRSNMALIFHKDT